MTVPDKRLGVHTSIAGGVHFSLERARELGCNTVQIFSHNPRQWSANMIPGDIIERFKELREAYDINPVFIHTSYLINLASSSRDILEKSEQLLIQEMDMADSLGADYVVLHTGSASGDIESNARKRAAEALKRVAGKGKWSAGLLLENTAGERGDISSRIEDMAEIIGMTGPSLVSGVCIDTCHAFAAGYNLSKTGGLKKLSEEIESYLGFDRVKLIHLNDSKKSCDSHVDRHEHLGRGGIGKEGLQRVVTHSALRDIPLILETPKKAAGDDMRNLKVARGFLI